ncbi:aminoacyl-tRNA hydrolase [Carboxydochorda subterranea]|uniref:Peptidyl-tRNA hydrolase n=1 Tax=Carboxydichorda subterranea TaxID=3109565 RepID=A0ABZ1BW49_9FIRM|nr:aminoacyl-tRNA hydrolase [Limnochorda sp. L945t]WRP17014.1 aminoacyl-tRNA hydrolase [Limnochorda sp. L945t]
MRLVVGLGNPGPRYATTRHNMGFRALDHLARRLGGARPVALCEAMVVRARSAGIEWLLAYPLTYMNESGRAVACLVDRWRVPLDAVLVVYDDMALPPGRIRIRRGGSSGAHKGMQSILDHLGTSQVARLRIGIGEPPPGVSGVDYVLQPPGPDEEPLLDDAVAMAAQAAECWGRYGVEEAMARFNAASPGEQRP